MAERPLKEPCPPYLGGGPAPDIISHSDCLSQPPLPTPMRSCQSDWVIQDDLTGPVPLPPPGTSFEYYKYYNQQIDSTRSLWYFFNLPATEPGWALIRRLSVCAGVMLQAVNGDHFLFDCVIIQTGKLLSAEYDDWSFQGQTGDNSMICFHSWPGLYTGPTLQTSCEDFHYKHLEERNNIII